MCINTRFHLIYHLDGTDGTAGIPKLLKFGVDGGFGGDGNAYDTEKFGAD